MNIPFVDLKAQYESIKGEVDEAISSVIDRTSFIGGELVSSFEESFASFAGLNHCVGAANGTDAIEIALKSLGIGQGDEVIVPALTWMSTGGAVNNIGAEPVFVDVLEDERTIDPGLIESKITNKTRAIIPVHLYGLSARMDEIMWIAGNHGLKVIEDCAQSHGATFKGKKIGTFGDVATFSFYPGKNFGAYGDAGAILTNHPELAEKCRMLSNHGQLKKHHHRIIGRNSRLDSMQAAILSAKLPHLNKWIEARQQVAQWYDDRLEGVTKPVIPNSSSHVFHLYVIQANYRDRLMSTLKEAQIGCAIHYPSPLPYLDCYKYKGHQPGEFPSAEKLCSEILSLPIFPELSSEAVNRVCKVINTF